jgi:hypothetical protein
MPPSHNAYLLRIELKDFKPAIYREVLVDPDITLRALHKVIQAAMGWEDAHLYAFAQPLRATESFWKIPNLRKWQKPPRRLGRAHVPLPHLLKAQNGCPPEDCGGPPGAEYWAAAWYDATHEDHETALDMFGDQEPGFLDFVALQAAVAKLKKPVRQAR